MTLKTRLWNWEAGLEASRKGMRSWKAYIDEVRKAKEAEAETMTHAELKAEFVELSILWAEVLSQYEIMGDAARHHLRHSDIFETEVLRTHDDHRRGAAAIHADDDKIKAKIKKDWEAWRDEKLHFDGMPEFTEYAMNKYKFPKDASSIRKWHKKWLEEKRNKL